MRTPWYRILSSLGVTACLFAAFSAAGEESKQLPFVAIFEMESQGSKLTPLALRNLTDYLAAKLVECGYQVIPQDQIRARLVQQKKASHKSCYDQSCQIELGRELSAQKSLSSKVMGFSGTCQVTATLYDLKKSAAEKAATAGGTCKEALLLKTIDTLVSKLCQATENPQRVDESSRATAEFEKVLRSTQKIKDQKDRKASAWSSVQKIAGDPSLGVSERAALLRKYLESFKGDNPYEREAEELLLELTPGRLNVTTDPPGATIYANGNPLGPSPVSLEFKVAKVVVSARLAGYAADDQEAVVEPDRDVRLVFLMQRPGVLSVVTEPLDASVAVVRVSNGAPISGSDQQTPGALELPAGNYTIKVSRDGYLPAEKTINLEAGKRLEVRIPLDLAPPGVLRVNTDPPGALIALGALTLGAAPVLRELRPGKYTIDAAADGFHAASREVEVVSGKESEVQMSLERIISMNPYKKWGHIAFWSGLGLAAFGASAAYLAALASDDDLDGDLSAADQSRAWTGAMFAGLGGGCALLVTGVILWVLSPGDREWFEAHSLGLSVAPFIDGASFALTRRF